MDPIRHFMEAPRKRGRHILCNECLHDIRRTATESSNSMDIAYALAVDSHLRHDLFAAARIHPTSAGTCYGPGNDVHQSLHAARPTRRASVRLCDTGSVDTPFTAASRSRSIRMELVWRSPLCVLMRVRCARSAAIPRTDGRDFGAAHGIRIRKLGDRNEFSGLQLALIEKYRNCYLAGHFGFPDSPRTSRHKAARGSCIRLLRTRSLDATRASICSSVG